MSASFVMLGQHPRATGCMQVYELDGADAKMVREVERPVRGYRRTLRCSESTQSLTHVHA